MDAAEPPRIVFETPAPCSDRARSEDLLRRALSAARAPGKGWSIAMRVERLGPRALQAEGDITDGDGMPVAHRMLSGANDCSGLARAVAVWASLVLDAERERAADAPAHASAMPGATPAAEASQTTTAPAAPSTVTSGWPPPAETEKPSPEGDWYLHHDDERTLEIGLGGFLMTGEGVTALAGGTAFGVVEVGNGVFLRPSLMFGKSTTSLPPQSLQATLVAGRIDSCLRLPGLYSNRRGMQLDACGGVDVGTYNLAGMTRGVLGLGPSMDLRGELGGALSAAIRGVFDVNAVRPTLGDSLLSVRLELAFSWSLR